MQENRWTRNRLKVIWIKKTFQIVKSMYLIFPLSKLFRNLLFFTMWKSISISYRFAEKKVSTSKLILKNLRIFQKKKVKVQRWSKGNFFSWTRIELLFHFKCCTGVTSNENSGKFFFIIKKESLKLIFLRLKRVKRQSFFRLESVCVLNCIWELFQDSRSAFCLYIILAHELYIAPQCLM